MNTGEELAKKRFLALNMVRLAAIGIVMAGIANISGKLLPDMTPWLGYFLLTIGAVDYFIVPTFLKRRWRTPDV